MKRKERLPGAGERGSILLGGLMLTLVITVLGVALFHLSVVESRLVLDNESNVQALEIAEIGLSRGLHLLYLDFVCNGTPSLTNCENPPETQSFIDGCIAGIRLDVPVANPACGATVQPSCPAALNPDGNVNFANFRLLKQDNVVVGGQNRPYTVCVSPGPNANQTTLRALGTMASATGIYNRVLETTATAVQIGSSGGGRAGMLAGPVFGGPILGNALIAASVSLVRCLGAPCTAVSFGGGGGMQNNYSGMDPAIRNLIPYPLPADPGGRGETLGAVFRVREGRVEITSNAARVGRPEVGGGSGSNTEQDTLTGVFSSGAWFGSQGNCPPLNGEDTTNNRCNVWTRASGPYPATGATAPPQLSDPAIIKNVGYRCFFLQPESTCTNPDPLPGGPNQPEFFYTNSWHVDDTRGDAGCDVNITGSANDCTAVLVGFAASIPPPTNNPVTGLPFTASDAIPIKAVACARQGGTNCFFYWPGTPDALTGANNFQVSIDGNPIRPDNLPVNLYVKRAAGGLEGLVRTSPSDDTEYTGMMIILADVAPADDGFWIRRSLLPVNTTGQPWCTMGVPPCNSAFPANHFLGLLTSGNIRFPNPGGTPHVVASFTANTIVMHGQTQVAGTFSGASFDMGSNVPKFFQAPYDLNWLPFSFVPSATNVTKLVANNWRECRAAGCS